LHELGADFVAGSGNKWQGGQPGTGLLYIRNKVLPESNPLPLCMFWPVVSIWYPFEGGLPERTRTRQSSYDIAEYLQATGGASLARMQTFAQACAIWDQLGRDRIERYLLDLSMYLKHRIAERWGLAALYSAMTDERLNTALTTFNPFPDPVLDEKRIEQFAGRLRVEFRIVVRPISLLVGSLRHHAIRIATRLFHNRGQVDRLIAAMAKITDDMS